MFHNTTPHSPHSLRFVTFLLRVALGVHLFYLGLGTIIDSSLFAELHKNKGTNALYYWLSAPENIGSVTLFLKWAFLIIGVALAVGLFTRLMSGLAIAIVALIYAANIHLVTLTIPQVVNEQLIIILCLLVIIFSKAGKYLGLDKFINISLMGKK